MSLKNSENKHTSVTIEKEKKNVPNQKFKILPNGKNIPTIHHHYQPTNIYWTNRTFNQKQFTSNLTLYTLPLNKSKL